MGTESGDLIVEPCTSPGLALRGDLQGLAIDVDGSILLNIQDHPTRRFADAPGPGCVLSEVAADDLPPPDRFFADWGPIEVRLNGRVYEMGSWSGFQDVRWTDPGAGGCYSMDGFGTNHRVGFGDGRMISGRFGEPSPLLFEFETCTTTVLSAIDVYVRGAMFYDQDYMFAVGSHLERWSEAGTLIWEGTGTTYFPNEIVRCGDDVCVAQGGADRLGRFSASDGSTIAQYDNALVFGVSDRIHDLGRAPDDMEILVAFMAEHPDASCDDAGNIWIYRVQGF